MKSRHMEMDEKWAEGGGRVSGRRAGIGLRYQQT